MFGEGARSVSLFSVRDIHLRVMLVCNQICECQYGTLVAGDDLVFYLQRWGLGEMATSWRKELGDPWTFGPVVGPFPAGQMFQCRIYFAIAIELTGNLCATCPRLRLWPCCRCSVRRCGICLQPNAAHNHLPFFKYADSETHYLKRPTTIRVSSCRRYAPRGHPFARLLPSSGHGLRSTASAKGEVRSRTKLWGDTAEWRIGCSRVHIGPEELDLA